MAMLRLSINEIWKRQPCGRSHQSAVMEQFRARPKHITASIRHAILVLYDAHALGTVRGLVSRFLITALHQASLAWEHIREPSVFPKIHSVLAHCILPDPHSLTPQSISLLACCTRSSLSQSICCAIGNKDLMVIKGRQTSG